MTGGADRKILRDLAGRYYNIAVSDKNAERVALYKGVNDLKMTRPVVLINEIPWHEMNFNGELDLKCEGDKARELEWFFRSVIFQQKYLPCDNYVSPFYPVYKHGSFGRMAGLEIDEKLIKNPGGGNIMSHEYRDVLQNDGDLEKLRYVPGGYDRESTMREFEYVSDLIGDIIPVKITGHTVGMGHKMWDDAARYRGVKNLLGDLAERPDFMHRIARKLTDGYKKSIECAVKNNMLEANYPELHCSPAFTDGLAPVADYDNIKPENVWGRGVAQIFGSVSPAMQEEFDLPYMIEVLDAFGLVYYGCCERLDNKLGVLKKMRNLRKISITPWSDINIASEIIGKDYEMSVKTNPAHVGAAFDENVIKNEIGAVIKAARKNGCAFDIVLKDISTVANRPANLIKWAEIASAVVLSY